MLIYVQKVIENCTKIFEKIYQPYLSKKVLQEVSVGDTETHDTEITYSNK